MFMQQQTIVIIDFMDYYYLNKIYLNCNLFIILFYAIIIFIIIYPLI
jgi:hypothetical protein